MKINYKKSGDTLYISLNGELDEHNANFVRTYLDDLFNNENFNNSVFDLYNLEFIDSTGVGVLIGRYKKLKAKNETIFITNPSVHADKIFLMSGLYQIMPRID